MSEASPAERPADTRPADARPADARPRPRSRDPWPPMKPGLGAWWRDHVRIARETLRFVSVRLGTSLLVWLLVGIALALPAGLFLVQVNLSGMTDDWDGRPGLTLYFQLDATKPQMDAVAEVLRGESAVESVKLTSREAALEEFRQYTSLADALDVLGDNPLPASARATLISSADVEDLDALTRLVGAEKGVAEVVVEKTWLERVSYVSTVVSRLTFVLGLMFGVGAVLVTATSVRLAIEARLDELRVLKLVGATDPQIRRPFLYYGLCYGLGGGLVAAMLISLCLLIIETPLTKLLGSYSQDLELTGFDPIFLAILLLIGGILGVGGARMAARARLRDLEIL